MSFGSPVRNGLGIGLTSSTALSTLRVGGRPAMFLNFVGATELSSNVTFSRGTTATFVGSNGLIQSAAINAPRFDYDPVTLAPKGILIEEQRTNLATYSEQFDNAAWAKTRSSIAADATTSPDGTVDADKLVEDTTATSTHLTSRVISASASTAYTQSVFLKAAGRTRGQLQLFGNSGGSTVTFDLTAGTSTAVGAYGGWASASTTITPFGNGWFRITNTATTNAGLTGVNFSVLLADAAGNASYTGDGTSGVFLWGAQLEAGAFATSYIPTVASQVTRTADQCSIVAPNFAPWYNQSEGSFVVSTSPIAVDNDISFSVSNSGGYNNSIYLPADSGSQFVVVNGGSVQANIDAGTFTANTTNRVAAAYKAADFAASVNGGAVVTTASGTIPTVDRAVIGGLEANTANRFNGHIRQIAYYNTRLPNATLQALTA